MVVKERSSGLMGSSLQRPMQHLLDGCNHWKQKLPEQFLQFWNAQWDDIPRAALNAAILLWVFSLVLEFFWGRGIGST